MAADQTFSWDYGKSHDSHEPELPKSIPPQGFNITEKQDCMSETWHITFRAFTSSEGSDPIEGLQSLRELCHLWLRPDIHTKEQILDKLVIEQFMISMPQELQVLVKESGVDSCKDLEDMLRNNVKPNNWVSRNFMISLGKGENVWGAVRWSWMDAKGHQGFILGPWFSHGRGFAPHGTLGIIWRQFWLSLMGRGGDATVRKQGQMGYMQQ